MPLGAWNRSVPKPHAVRPAQCPACGLASRPVGCLLNLVGHGLRDLLLLGVVEVGAEPVLISIRARRYRCRACRSVCMVVPAGVAPRRRYTWPTIALALALFSLKRQSPAAIRRLLSRFPITGAAVVGWASLRRWARAYGVGEGTLRDRAARTCQQLLATSPLSAQRHAMMPRIFAASLSTL